MSEVTAPQIHLNRKACRLLENVAKKYISEKKFCPPNADCYLARIPIDILERIVLFNEVEDNFRLFKCGQGLLNHNMRFHAWREFDAEIDIYEMRIKWWPYSHILSQIQAVRAVNIKLIYPYHHSKHHAPYVFRLEHLEGLRHNPLLQNFSFDRVNARVHPYIEEQFKGFDKFSFSEVMPNLKSLIWFDDTNLLGMENIANLPVHLTCLKVHAMSDNVTFRSLPIRLETLYIAGDLEWNRCDGVQDMTSLSDLSISINTNGFVSENLCDLPISVTKLELYMIANIGINSATHNDSNHFRLQLLSPSYLPPSLVHLDMNGAIILTTESVLYLPTTLLSLRVRFEELKIDCIEQLPPRLQTLSFTVNDFSRSGIRRCCTVDDAVLAALPRSLREIDFFAIMSFTKKGVLEYLPPLLPNHEFMKHAFSSFGLELFNTCQHKHKKGISTKSNAVVADLNLYNPYYRS